MNNNYLIYGEDKYLIENNIKKIIKQNNIDENLVIKYNMEEEIIENLINELDTYDMFQNKKIVVCDNSIFLSSESKKNSTYNTDLLIKYLNNSNPNSILIITLNSNIDERKKISKEVKKLCNTITCNKLNEYELSNYIKDKLNKGGYKINNNDINLFIKYIGDNLMDINNELVKLIMYKDTDKIITTEDINKVISKNNHNNIFDLIDCVLTKNKNKIFEVYEDLMLYNNEEPTKIIVMLANQFRLILQCKLLNDKGIKESEIAKKLGIHPYRVKLAVQRCKTLSYETLKKYLLDLSNLDLNIKSGKDNKNIGLELFFLNI